ncbi:hypothetical protein C1645_832240 [Glomus cerebriforme]|uniref:F-box domain-containing protein n=1 Tax=Glomus cerebriforme TaxID=658196 RepID=A0A397SDY1_9GLOM|nr:hypothetical protein C1645_832240 [Glomus cerebriforme]
MPKSFPPEIIRLFVLYLKDDKESLHSCLLVSRDWCREAVYLLWRRPFYLLYTCDNTNLSVPLQSTNPKLTNDCDCSEAQKSEVANLLMNTYYSINYYDEMVKEGIIDTKSRNTLFNYFEFLNELDLHELSSAIRDWINYWENSDNKIRLLNLLNSKFNLNSIYPPDDYDDDDDYTPLTFKSIYRYFFTYSSELKLFSFDAKFILRKTNNNNPCFFLKVTKRDYFQAFRHDQILLNQLNEFNFPEIKQSFTNLTELVFTARGDKSTIFSLLSQICHNIQKMIITIEYDCSIICTPLIEKDETLEESKVLASLIKSQHNLIYFELFDTHQEDLSEILKALKESQHNSLKTLIFNYIVIDNNDDVLIYLKYFQNLQELRFNKCNYGRNWKMVDEKKNYYEEGLWLPNLKCLQIDYKDAYKEESEELSSILFGCSPLLNEI